MSSDISDDDTFTLVLLGPTILSVLAPYALGVWADGRDWMIERNLVATGDDAIFAIPGWDGAGIGGVHIVVVAAALVCFMVLGSIASRQRANSRDRALRKRHMDDPFGS